MATASVKAVRSRHGIGAPVPRPEDRLLTTGRATFVSDVSVPGMLHMAVLRSPHAHARVAGVDVTAARELPGVVGAYGPADLPAIRRPLPALVEDPRLDPILPTPLADGVVRYVGEPVAVVLAEDRYRAEDALEAIRTRYEPLPALATLEAAAAGPPLHPGRADNRAATLTVRSGDGAAALDKATVVVRRDLRLSRVVAHPMEGRGLVAIPEGGRLTVLAATQGPHNLRRGLALALGLAPAEIQVRVPHVGGGFGVKNRIYPEDVLACHLALATGRPVKWVADRREEFLATIQERDQVHHAAVGLDDEGRIVAVVDRFLVDNGAYTTAGVIVAETTAICIPGPYRVPNFEASAEIWLTNKTPVGPYRGAGRPQAAFVMERLLDQAADEMGLDRAEIRRRNLIRRDEMPYDTGVPGRGGANIVYDDGDFPAAMETVLDAIGYADFERRREAARRRGFYLGVGVANAVEMSSTVGFETARLTLGPGGTVEVATGTSSQGHGHATAFAQIAHERLGVPFEAIVVREGDTSAVARGIGTFGSRSTVMAGNAVAKAARGLRARILDLASQVLGVPADRLSLEDGQLVGAGEPVPLVEILRRRPDALPLAAEAVYESSRPTYGAGCHGAVVAVDPVALTVRLEEYVACHDHGVVVNPLLAEGQVIGGAVQGIGTALFEELVVDEAGQVQNASFLDYLLPLAAEMPDLHLFEQSFPATTNPEGFKGLGEGGTIPAAAAVAAAVEDALRPLGIRVDRIPVTPRWLAEVLERAKGDEGS